LLGLLEVLTGLNEFVGLGAARGLRDHHPEGWINAHPGLGEFHVLVDELGLVGQAHNGHDELGDASPIANAVPVELLAF
jgi:hypothetical protein